MIIKKENLSFLNTYAYLCDAKDVNGSYVKIKIDKNENKIHYLLSTNDVVVLSSFTILEEYKIQEKEDTYIFPVMELVQIINRLPDNSMITFDGSTISVGTDIKYSFAVSMSISNFEKDLIFYKSLINKKAESIINLCNISKINKIKYYIGNEAEISFVALMDKHFVVSNKSVVTVFMPVQDIDYGNTFYFSKKCIDTLNRLNIDKKEMIIDLENNFYSFTEGNIGFLYPIRKCIIPNIFTERGKAIYEHKTKCVVSKSLLKEALGRISIVTKNNYQTRLYIAFNENNIILNNRENNEAQEKLGVVSIDPELIGHDIVVSTYWLSNIIGNLEGEQIHMYVLPDKENARVMKISDEKNEMSFILSLGYYF